MSMMDPITDALTRIKNAEFTSKKECEVRPASKFLGELLKVAKENDYIESFKEKKEGKIAAYTIKLNGKINTFKGIKPRYAVKKDNYEKYEKRYLPARDVGIIIVSTSQGVMTHNEAKKKGIGGRLVAYIY
jgi:small subunit ribosomal protein S8